MFYNFYYHRIEKGTIWAFIIALAENLLVEQHIEQAKSSCLSAYFFVPNNNFSISVNYNN